MPRVVLLVWILAATPPLTPRANSSSRELHDLVSSGHLEDLRYPDFKNYKSQVEAFYEKSGYAPVWSGTGVLTQTAATILPVLKNADSKGLDPDEYDAWRLTDREPKLARFDLALTVSLMRYISDVHFGRANPGLFHEGFDLMGENNLPDFITRHVLNATDAAQVLAGIEPPFEGYRRTEAALEQYLILARENSQAKFTALKKPIEPGSPFAETARLAALLRKLGDLPAGASIPESYSGPLVPAVKHFQLRHGLDPDGRIGNATLAQLNTPLRQRVLQLQLSLERWRWVPHRFSRPPIVVNIPEFELRALNGNYETVLEMEVVVGKAFHHQTPVFAAGMKRVVFRPYWDVPLSIQIQEVVPKLDEDRAYLVKNHFEVVTQNNELVSTGAVDDALLARLRSRELRIRQVPGPENSLGSVKFLFPNPYDVYLHATPATQLFSRARRDFSHGCIRVEKPVDLAAWVLSDQPEWTRERILAAMNGDRTIEVALDRPIPVLIVYATAVVLRNGDVRFFNDIYGLDAQLERAIARRLQAAIPTSGGRGRDPRE